MFKKRRDSYCVDGVISDGERIVRKGGIVLFAKGKWQSDKLLPVVGETVTIFMDDYWMTEAFASWLHGDEFCNLKRL